MMTMMMMMMTTMIDSKHLYKEGPDSSQNPDAGNNRLDISYEKLRIMRRIQKRYLILEKAIALLTFRNKGTPLVTFDSLWLNEVCSIS
jgi:hypothetical protein